MAEVLILEGARTPFSTWAGGERPDGQKGGLLKPFDPFDLAAAALKGACAKAGLAAGAIERLVFGNMYHVGPHACYGARYAGHRAGLAPETPGLGVNIACGTGLQALATAAESVARGEAGVAAAVGADNASLVRRDVFVPSFTDLSCAAPADRSSGLPAPGVAGAGVPPPSWIGRGRPIALTAQDLAAELGISREDQDRWALRSHRLSARARGQGLLAQEIVPLGEAREDDAILPDPQPGHFAGSQPLAEGSAATHANTHAIVDGASALILASPRAAREAGARPLGKYLGSALVGLKPEAMAYGSVYAIRKLLSNLGLESAAIELFEINETFAAQMLIGVKALGLPEEKVNVNGGAIALGHPFAGTGCRLVLTLLKELRRRGQRRGVASICVGGGLGIAVAVESLPA